MPNKHSRPCHGGVLIRDMLFILLIVAVALAVYVAVGRFVGKVVAG